MTLSGKQMVTYVAGGVLLGILIGSYAACALGTSAPNASAPSHVQVSVSRPTAMPVDSSRFKPDTITRFVHGAQGAPDTVTQYVKAPFWLDRTIYIHDTVPAQAAPPKPFTIANVLTEAGPIVLAHFQPKRDENLFELYLHAHRDLFPGGSFGGGAEIDMNLEQLHITPMTLYADLGYDRAPHFEVGISGKVWGAW